MAYICEKSPVTLEFSRANVLFVSDETQPKVLVPSQPRKVFWLLYRICIDMLR